MNRSRSTVLLATMALSLAANLWGAQSVPVNVIFDSDMDGDCDDVAALALLHVLADRGEATILATVTSCRSEWSPQCIDAINTYYGRADVPVGAPRNIGIQRPSKYTKAVIDRLPHDLKNATDAPGAIELYRKVLLDAPDQSVVIATVGFHTNLAALLKLPAEGDMPSGMDLVKRKVKEWACMGGNFLGKPARDDLKLGNVNFQKDADAALYAITNWPGRIVFVGRQIGSVPSGLQIGANFAKLDADHPVRIAYEAYFGGTCKDRHIADPTTILYAVRGRGELWDIEDAGYIDLKPDMTFEWKYDQDKDQAYLIKKQVDGKPNDRAIEKIVEELIMSPRQAR